MIKELIYFTITLCVVAFTWHSKQFTEYPLDHISHLLDSGLFILHPIVITIVIYFSTIYPIRAFIKKRSKKIS